MKILFLSSLCSTPLLPNLSPGNARILRALRAIADCRVIIPVPWFSAGHAGVAGEIPAVEVDQDGSPIFHPRILHIPGVARFCNGVFYTLSVASIFHAEVARFQPDVILAPWAYPDATAAVALGKRAGVPVVVRAMGSDINQVAHLPGRRTQVRWTLRHAGRVVAVSRALGQAIAALGVPDQRIAVIPTGIEPAIFYPRDRAEARTTLGLAPGPLVLVAARLSLEKGLMHLLAAMSLAGEGCGFALVVVGDGAQRRELEQEARRRGLGDRVRFEGFQPEARMPLYYSAADLLCLPSLAEGWPDALMESFACGCPVVASAVGGVPEIMALTDAGLTVPPANPDALARALAECLARDWDRSAIAEAMRFHTIAATARRYLEVCQDAIQARVPT
jgi:glycosyltransferase involved in cell wall biosynthesis